MAGDYIIHASCRRPDDPPVQPASAEGDREGAGCLYHIVREEDVNVDLGNQFAPAIPPPPCTGDNHLIDQATLVAAQPVLRR